MKMDELKSRLEALDSEKFEVDGIVVKKRLPMKTLVEIAAEIAKRCIVIEKNVGAIYESHEKVMWLYYFFAKYFTDIEVPDEDDLDGVQAVYDLIDSIEGRTVDLTNFYRAEEMYDDIFSALAAQTKAEHSLSTRLMTWFGSFLGDKDVAETLAKSTKINNEMVRLMGKFMQDSGKPTNRNAPLNITKNNVVNFSKKK